MTRSPDAFATAATLTTSLKHDLSTGRRRRPHPPKSDNGDTSFFNGIGWTSSSPTRFLGEANSPMSWMHSSRVVESEPVTFCVRTLRHLNGFEVTAGELVSRRGERLAAPHVQLVRSAPRTWQGEEPLAGDGPVGVMNMPTYLERARRVNVAAGRTLQFWLTARAHEDAQPGAYRGEILISHAEGETHRISIKLNVLPITLRTPPQVLGFWDFQRPYQGEIGSLDAVYQMMSDHGANAVFMRAGLYEYDKAADSYSFGKFLTIDDAGHVVATLDGSPLAASLAAAKKADFQKVIYTPTLWMLAAEETIARYDRARLDRETADEIVRVTRQFEGSPQDELIKEELTAAGRTYFPMYSQAYADLYVKLVPRGHRRSAETRLAGR